MSTVHGQQPYFIVFLSGAVTITPDIRYYFSSGVYRHNELLVTTDCLHDWLFYVNPGTYVTTNATGRDLARP